MTSTNYFSHDANASLDTKILKLRKKYGLAGYGLFWIILERFRQEEKYNFKYSDDEFEVLEFLTSSEIDIKEFIDECIKIKLFKIDKEGNLYSESFYQRMKMYEETKDLKRKAGKIGAEKRWQKNSSAIAVPLADDSSAIAEPWQTHSNAIAKNSKLNKTKQTKLNETKLNKTKQNNIEKNNESVVDVVGETYKFFKSLFPEMKLDTADWMTMSTYAKEKPELFRKACQIGKESDAKTFKYITGIINNWQGQGIESVNDLIPKKKSKFANYEEVKIDYENFDEDNMNKLLEKYGGTN